MEEGIGGRIPAPHYSLLHYDDDQNDVGENLVRGDIRFRPEDKDTKQLDKEETTVSYKLSLDNVTMM